MHNLLSINNYHYRRGGSDVMYFEHDALFKGIGWGTASFSMKHPKNISSEWEKYFIEELEFGQSYGVFDKLKMASKVIYSLEARSKITALLDHFSPDIAHIHCVYHHISPSILPLLKERAIPLVYTAHDLKLACPAYKMLNQNGICEKCKDGNLLHLVANRCIHGSLATSGLVAVESALHRILGLYKNTLDRIVAPSRFFKTKLEEWGWSADKIVYIPNFVDEPKFEKHTSPGKYFLYFGRLAPEKGVETLIRACIASGCELKIAGTGPSELHLKSIASSNPKINFLGFKAGDDLWELVRGARAVVLPSEWYENAPVSVLEAYAIGKIVIGANIGGIPEMIVENETGFTFPSGATDALADVLKKVEAMDDASIARMGEQSIEYVAQNYSQQAYLERMLSLYENLLSKRNEIIAG